MEKNLKYKKTEYCTRFVQQFPFITPAIIGKHLYTEAWMKNKMTACIHGHNTLKSLVDQGRINRANSPDAIFLKVGKDKRVGRIYFFHNQALFSVLIDLDLHGYTVKYGGLNEKFPNCDGIVWVNNEPIAIELDCGNHSAKALHDQIMKYDKSPFKKILYVTYPTRVYNRQSGEQIDSQIEQEKNLRRKMKAHKIPYALRQKILSTTYIQASDPTTDPLESKVWRTLNGTYTTVL